MPAYSCSDHQITINQNPIFLSVGFGAGLMSVFGFRLLFGLLPLERGYTYVDVFGVAFVCVWIAVVLCMSFFALETGSRSVTIDRHGVVCRSWFRKDFLAWYDIRDWGLSYCGQTRGEGNTYYLYFSRDICPEKNAFKKKLNRHAVKALVVADAYDDAINRIIPFCQEKTGVIPFVAEDKYHFF